MVVDERERRLLQEALVDSIGSEPTDTLMHYLPPVGWADVATKQDLHSLETVLRIEIDGVRTEMGAMEDRLRAELADLRGEFRGEMGGLRGEFRGEMGGLEARLHRELRIQFYWTATLFAVLLAAFVAALKLV